MTYRSARLGTEGGLDLLGTLPLEKLLPAAETLTPSQDEVICRENQFADHLFLVLRGSCVWRETIRRSSGRLIAKYNAGDTIDPDPTALKKAKDSGLIAEEDCVLLRLNRAQLPPLVSGRGMQPGRQRPSEQNRTFNLVEPVSGDRVEGRLITLASTSRAPEARNIARSLEAQLEHEAGASVASITFIRLDGNRADSRAVDCILNGVSLCTPGVIAAAAPHHILRVGFHGDNPSTQALDPLLKVLRRRFEYVLLSVQAAETPESLMFKCISQSDTAYLLTTPHAESVRQTGELLTDLKRRLNSHFTVTLRTVPCIAEGQKTEGVDERFRSVGTEVHTCLRYRVADVAACPAGDPLSLSRPYRRGLRLIAREITGRLVGLALSSGGVKGMAHVGVIQVLEENGLDVDVVAGSSMGAYIGSLWAYGCDASQLVELAMEMSTKHAVWRVVDPVFPPRQGFLRGEAIKKRLQRTIGDAHFHDLIRPFRVVATDLDTLERAVFSTGEVAKAVHASAAVPGIIVPVRIGDRAFMDGGIVDPLPTGVLWEMGIRRILAVSTIPTTADIRRRLKTERRLAPHAKPRARKVGKFPTLNENLNYFAQGNILDIFMHSIQGGQIRVAQPSFKQANLLLRPRLTDTRWLDFSITRRCVAAGRAVAEHHLEEIKALLKPKGASNEQHKLVQAMATTA